MMVASTNHQPLPWMGLSQRRTAPSGTSIRLAAASRHHTKTSLSPERLSRRFQVEWAREASKTRLRERPVMAQSITSASGTGREYVPAGHAGGRDEPRSKALTEEGLMAPGRKIRRLQSRANVGSACGIRTRDLRLERAVSWASRRTRHAVLTNSGAQLRIQANQC